MKGRYAGVSMRARKATLPGVARLARLPAEPSTEATRRLTVMKWYEEHGRNVRLTARRFGFSPDTVSRWVRRYEERGVRGLENRSRRPIHVRRPQTPPHVVQRILELREESPGCGREKLHRLLLAEGVAISPKSIDRVIARLKARGVLREPIHYRKAAKPHLKRLAPPQTPKTPARPICGAAGCSHSDGQQTGPDGERQDGLSVRRHRLLYP